jgi:hypothetical protein
MDMTGSSVDFIVIPIVATICLAAWLIMVYYADSHPGWRGTRTRAQETEDRTASSGNQLGRRPVQLVGLHGIRPAAPTPPASRPPASRPPAEARPSD